MIYECPVPLYPLQVEHGTHRAVIIDMGLAKFSFGGLSSAQDFGNLAYSAPEILQANGGRDKRSDVWAMGKIITELISGVRQRTDFVSPFTIWKTLKDSPYCNIVSKMVATNPSERPSMVEVITEIRWAGRLLGADVTAKQGAGTGQPNAGLVAQGGARGAWPASPAAKRKCHGLKAAPQADLVPGSNRAFVTEFSKMLVPLLPEGRVTQLCYKDKNGQLRIKVVVTRNGQMVKYWDVKIGKS